MWYDSFMNIETLQAKQLAIETNFNELTKQKQDIDTELVKLQGEYRVITELIEANKPKESEKNG